jgi:tetratricopeptide (TPR) repeat protein
MKRCWLAGWLAVAAAGADWSQSPAFAHFYNLRYDAALAALDQQLQATPDDPGVHNFVAYTVLYRRLFLSGALSSTLALDLAGFRQRGNVVFTPEEQQRFETALRRSMELSEARLRANPRDVEALYTLGVAQVHRAAYAWLVKKSWRDALGGGTASRKYHQRALEADSTFIDARLLPAVHDFVVGSLPGWMKPLAFLAGFRGDKDGGLREIERVAREGKGVRTEARVILAVFLQREKQHARAVPWMAQLAADFPQNYLYQMEHIRLLLLAERPADAARELAALEAGMAPEGRYAALPPAKMLGLKADVEMANRRFDAALTTLARLDALAAGNAEITAQAWLRRGRVRDLQGNRAEALAAYRAAIRTAPNSEAAAEARKLLDRPYRRPGG